MKRILSVLFAATMIFGMAANASANMGNYDFALMTLNETRALETVDSLGPVWDEVWGHDPFLPPAGTTAKDMFHLSDFNATSWSEFETVAVSNFEWISSDYSGQRAWIAIQKDATPRFDKNPGAFVTGYTGVYLYHEYGTPEVKAYGDAGQGVALGGLHPLDFLGGFENEGVASVKLDTVLTDALYMDIWEVNWTTASGNLVEWEKSGFDLKIYNSGGTDLGTECIDGVIISAVPIPGAVWLLVSGLLAVMGIRRRKL